MKTYGVQGEETDVPLDDVVSSLATGPVCIKFTASWCGPCRVVQPKYAAAAAASQARGAGMAFYAVDVDEHAEVAATYAVKCMPTFVCLIDGAEYGRTEGTQVPRLLQLIVDTEDHAKKSQEEEKPPAAQLSCIGDLEEHVTEKLAYVKTHHSGATAQSLSAPVA
jgi:thioredoxin 1